MAKRFDSAFDANHLQLAIRTAIVHPNMDVLFLPGVQFASRSAGPRERVPFARIGPAAKTNLALNDALLRKRLGHGRVAPFDGSIVEHGVHACWNVHAMGNHDGGPAHIQLALQCTVLIQRCAHSKPCVNLIESGGRAHLFRIRDDNNLAFERTIGVKVESPIRMIAHNTIDGKMHGIAGRTGIAGHQHVPGFVHGHAVQVVLHTDVTKMFR